MPVQILVNSGDALSYSADVLILKYAQRSYGADGIVVSRLLASNPGLEANLPKPGSPLVCSGAGAVAAEQVLFVGVPSLSELTYADIRQFAKNALSMLHDLAAQSTRSVALTVPGPNYGLDELACFDAVVAGLLDQLSSELPSGLATITIMENSPRRARRFAQELEKILASSTLQRKGDLHGGVHADLQPGAAERLYTAGAAQDRKPVAFVAMPFREEMLDVYDYGILAATGRAGFLCERADQEHFTGDILSWVRQRIDACAIVVADLSFMNPNVYLEVGYAWGRGKPTVLLIQDGQELPFDVRGQRCLKYKRIKHLEEQLFSDLLAVGSGNKG